MDEQEATDRLASIKICSVVKQLADHVKTDNKLEYIKFCASYALDNECIRSTRYRLSAMWIEKKI